MKKIMAIITDYIENNFKLSNLILFNFAIILNIIFRLDLFSFELVNILLTTIFIILLIKMIKITEKFENLKRIYTVIASIYLISLILCFTNIFGLEEILIKIFNSIKHLSVILFIINTIAKNPFRDEEDLIIEKPFAIPLTILIVFFTSVYYVFGKVRIFGLFSNIIYTLLANTFYFILKIGSEVLHISPATCIIILLVITLDLVLFIIFKKLKKKNKDNNKKQMLVLLAIIINIVIAVLSLIMIPPFAYVELPNTEDEVSYFFTINKRIELDIDWDYIEHYEDFDDLVDEVSYKLNKYNYFLINDSDIIEWNYKYNYFKKEITLEDGTKGKFKFENGDLIIEYESSTEKYSYISSDD